MRNFKSLLFLSFAAVSATACAGRAHTSSLVAGSKPTTYVCNETRSIVRSANGVRPMHSDVALAQGWRDDQGAHFVAWPSGPTTLQTIAYFVPDDPLSDAVETVYDTSGGSSRADWKLVRKTTCTANGGYSDALARFADGKSFDQVANELGTNKRDAREMVHQALVTLNKRYYGH